jgi:hypothetical protein
MKVMAAQWIERKARLEFEQESKLPRGVFVVLLE